MANPEQESLIACGTEVWNRWRGNNRLAEVDLRGIDLAGANLSLADLDGADLTGAKLGGANLTATILHKAVLKGADLSGTNLSGAIATGADLGGAVLYGVILERTVLDDADVNAALLASTIFAATDLSSVKGLDSVVHIGPSTIGIDTLFLSKGAIPETFLRGAGVPNEFISYAKSLVGSAIEFYSCFISYSTRDEEFAIRLHADLQANGVRCWFAPHNVQGGRKLHEQIDEAIRLHDKLLLVLSPHSMASEWVRTEISKARKRGVRGKRRVLFPIGLAPFDAIRDWENFDADIGKDSAREIREYFIPDFTKWKDHDSYQKAFERLLRDLRQGSLRGSVFNTTFAQPNSALRSVITPPSA